MVAYPSGYDWLEYIPANSIEMTQRSFICCFLGAKLLRHDAIYGSCAGARGEEVWPKAQNERDSVVETAGASGVVMTRSMESLPLPRQFGLSARGLRTPCSKECTVMNALFTVEGLPELDARLDKSPSWSPIPSRGRLLQACGKVIKDRAEELVDKKPAR
jgi:hypothetical protein